MCRINALFSSDPSKYKSIFDKMMNEMYAYGDFHDTPKIFSKAILGTTRLGIIDQENAVQPLINEDKSIVCVFNGEIYNHLELRSKLKKHRFRTKSDGEVLLHGFEEWGKEIISKLDGQFAFVIYDSKNNTIFAGRDPLGIKPLHYIFDNKYMIFSSELKSIQHKQSTNIQIFPPGSIYINNHFEKYYEFIRNENSENNESLIEIFDSSVRKRVQTDLPIAILLSGGIDSALVLKYAKKYHKNITAYTLGDKGSSDVNFAKQICEKLSVKHKIISPNRHNMRRNLNKYIFLGETFEPNQINTLGLTYELSKTIHQDGIKIALSGEGADELFAGYSEFISDEELSKSLERYVHLLHRTQLQRVDRMCAVNQVEVRVPFLDKKILEYASKVPCSKLIKHNISKFHLRKQFQGELPEWIIWREKQAFPVGAANRQEFSNDEYSIVPKGFSERDLLRIQKKYPEYKITSLNEAYFFSLYIKQFPNAHFNTQRFEMKSR